MTSQPQRRRSAADQIAHCPSHQTRLVSSSALTQGQGSQRTGSPSAYLGDGRAPDPFAPHIRALVVANAPDSRTVATISDVAEVAVVASAAAAREFVAAEQFTGPEDVVVIDGAPSDAATLTTVQEFRRRGCSVMLLSRRCDELAVSAAWHYGTCAYVVTGTQPRACARDAVATFHLSEREIAVLQAVADGATNCDIGRQLNISGLTVKSHLARIGHKLHTGDRAAMVARVMRAGLIH